MKALICGSFDPFTNGHMYLVEQSAKMFDTVIIGVATNPAKKYMFSLTDRYTWIKNAVAHIKNVEVVYINSSLVVDYCYKNGIGIIVKGVRNAADFNYEKDMADANLLLCREVHTIFIPTPPELQGVSSSMVRTVINTSYGYRSYVPSQVFDGISKEMEQRRDIYSL